MKYLSIFAILIVCISANSSTEDQNEEMLKMEYEEIDLDFIATLDADERDEFLAGYIGDTKAISEVPYPETSHYDSMSSLLDKQYGVNYKIALHIYKVVDTYMNNIAINKFMYYSNPLKVVNFYLNPKTKLSQKNIPLIISDLKKECDAKYGFILHFHSVNKKLSEEFWTFLTHLVHEKEETFMLENVEVLQKLSDDNKYWPQTIFHIMFFALKNFHTLKSTILPTDELVNGYFDSEMLKLNSAVDQPRLD